MNPFNHTRIIALINQKGGVGKTTSTVNLGAALSRAGHPTLLIDLDPQAHLTLHLGLDPDQLPYTIYDLMTKDHVQVDEVRQTITPTLHVLPSHMNLAGVEAELAPKMVTGEAQRILRLKLTSIVNPKPDPDSPAPAADKPAFALIDCPPSLGLLTINALTATQQIIVPLQAHFLALQGLSQLLKTVQLVKQSFNPDLVVSGLLLCMHETQTLLAKEVLSELSDFLASARDQDVPWRDARLLEPMVRRNIKLAECPSFGKSIFDYEPHCRGAEDYGRLAESLVSPPLPPASPAPPDHRPAVIASAMPEVVVPDQKTEAPLAH